MNRQAMDRPGRFCYTTASPVFSIAYLGEVDENSHRVVCAGGGGSSRSGVKNTITAADVDESSLKVLCILDTGKELCSYVCVGRNKSMLVSIFNNGFCLCKLRGLRPGLRGSKAISIASQMYVSDLKMTDPSINCCAVDGADGDLLAVGGDDGKLRMWAVLEARDRFSCTLKKAFSPAHAAPITDCSFSESGHLVATASKDGSCRIWSISTGAIICELLVESAMPFCGKKNRSRSQKLIVRACKFIGDDTLISIQSAARGSAFAAKWNLAASGAGSATLAGALAVSVRITRHPVSAVCVGQGLIAHGDVEGLVGFVRVNDLRQTQGPIQVHQLPVTSLVVATNNASVSAQSCALSVSADYKLAATPLISFEFKRAVAYISVIVTLLAVFSFMRD
mmetsp:Transcript_30214/g.90496  ORF Transcript_30214/g.90496 Transcript_30214/m.90496 type:complete len:394 (-) Transcript_30214:568-1749(-)